MKWPKPVEYRRKILAKIYRKTKDYPFYRVSYTVDGKRMMKSFACYAGEGGAKEWAEEKVKELAKGSKAAALTARQADDALAALRHLQAFYEGTGKRISLLEGISGYCAAVKRLGSHTLSDAIERFLSTVAVVQRKALAEAVAEFIQGRKHLAESSDGKRSRRSPVYTYNVAMWLKEFSNTLPGHAVCDLNKELLNAYIGHFKELSAKSRNDRRAVVKMFLRWCMAKDYLDQNHRLFEAVDFKTEDAETTEIDYFRTKELRDMLDNADSELMPVIALGGLAGLRREEILRLDWSDVWRVKGKVEISAKIAKGRKRRLVNICPALAAWLRPYRNVTGPVWSKSPDTLEEAMANLRETAAIPARRNGLRHAFVTFHMSLHSNENLTAAEAGNSPQVIHDHYRALVPRRDAVKWFQVKPPRAKGAENVIHLEKPWLNELAMTQRTDKKIDPSSEAVSVALAQEEYDFSDVPEDELEDCVYYEYARESKTIIRAVVKFRRLLLARIKGQDIETCLKLQATIASDHAKLIDNSASAFEATMIVQLAFIGKFPLLPWKRLSTQQKFLLRDFKRTALEADIGRLLHEFPPVIMDSLFQNPALGGYTLDAWKKKVMPELYLKIPAPLLEEGLISGFFMINLAYKEEVIIEQFRDWLKSHKPAVSKMKKPEKGRKSKRDYLNTLGALRLRYYCQTLTEAQELIAQLSSKSHGMSYSDRTAWRRACEGAVQNFRKLLLLPLDHLPIHYTEGWQK